MLVKNMVTRRQFNKMLLVGATSLAMGGCISKPLVADNSSVKSQQPELKFSVSQWALQTAQFGNLFNDNYQQWQTWLLNDPGKVLQGKLSPLMFPEYVQKTFAISAVDFVNTFYFDQINHDSYWAELKLRCNDNGIVANNIMLDQAGYLGHNDSNERAQAIDKHKKWIDIAAKIGCSSVRINVHGIGDWQTQLENSIESCRVLADYAKANDLLLLVENHGGLSSNADWLLALMQQANHPALQVMLDYDNFKWSETEIWHTDQVYDRYQGVEKLMPYANCVSVKTYEFDDRGNETTIDVGRMVEIAKRHNFNGYHSLDFEGHAGDPIIGIKQTEDLLKRVWSV